MTINYLAIIVCGFVAFVLSSVWYMAFSKTRADLLGFDVKKEKRPSPLKSIIELLRTMLLAAIFAVILSHLRLNGLHQSLWLGLLLWVAFPVILLSGSVMWDKVPAKLALIHAGDWFIKLFVIAVIVGACSNLNVMSVIDDHLAKLTTPQREALERIRALVHRMAPGAEETIGYGMPVIKYNGKYLIGFDAFKDHLSIFPGAEPVEALKAKLSAYKTAKGTVQFTLDQPIPEPLLREIIALCVARNSRGVA